MHDERVKEREEEADRNIAAAHERDTVRQTPQNQPTLTPMHLSSSSRRPRTSRISTEHSSSTSCTRKTPRVRSWTTCRASTSSSQRSRRSLGRRAYRSTSTASRSTRSASRKCHCSGIASTKRRMKTKSRVPHSSTISSSSRKKFVDATQNKCAVNINYMSRFVLRASVVAWAGERTGLSHLGGARCRLQPESEPTVGGPHATWDAVGRPARSTW